MVDRNKALLLVVSVVLGFVSWTTQTFGLLPPEVYNTISLVGAVLGAAFIGHSALKTLLSGVFGIDLLATVAIVASIALGENLAAVVVVLMLGGGEVLEEYISGRANRAIDELIDAFPKNTIVIHEGTEVELPLSKVQLGDIVIVKPGGV